MDAVKTIRCEEDGDKHNECTVSLSCEKNFRIVGHCFHIGRTQGKREMTRPSFSCVKTTSSPTQVTRCVSFEVTATGPPVYKGAMVRVLAKL